MYLQFHLVNTILYWLILFADGAFTRRALILLYNEGTENSHCEMVTYINPVTFKYTSFRPLLCNHRRRQDHSKAWMQNFQKLFIVHMGMVN